MAIEKRALHKKMIEENPCVKTWMENYKPDTRKNYMVYAYQFFKWVENEGPEEYRGCKPQDLLDLQNNCKTQTDTFKQVELLKAWMRTMPGTYRTKVYLRSIVYGFYAYNHVPLPRDPNFKLKPERDNVESSLSIDELKNIILSSNKLYQAVFTIMFQSGMGEQEFIYFNEHDWPKTKEQLDKGQNIIRVDLPGRKHRSLKPGSKFFTFFGDDGIRKLKDYLQVRGKRASKPFPPLEEAIFVNEKAKPLTKDDITTYFKRHAITLGIVKKKHNKIHARYRVHAHEIRDTFKTEWTTTPAKGIMSEFFLGHIIDRNNYNKIWNKKEWARQQYKLALPWLNILSEDPRKVSYTTVREMQQKIGELEQRNRELKERLNGQTPAMRQLRDELEELRAMVKTLAQKEG